MSISVITDWREAHAQVRAMQRAGKRVGVTPTMGALHAGHLSLVEASNQNCDASVVTIFVNPTQFGPHEDFEKYPRTLESDLEKLSSLDVAFVFAPSAESMYPAEASTGILPPAVATPLEGEMRPGHFEGVCTIVCKLFLIIPADVAYFGQKDYQQCLVIRHMVRDLNMSIEIDVRPIVRESDGLALSSRNRYLSSEERNRALGLSRALNVVDERVAAGERDAVKLMAEMRSVLSENGVAEVQYAVLADPDSLETASQASPPLVALIAARVGETRLIDNRIIASS